MFNHATVICSPDHGCVIAGDVEGPMRVYHTSRAIRSEEQSAPTKSQLNEIQGMSCAAAMEFDRYAHLDEHSLQHEFCCGFLDHGREEVILPPNTVSSPGAPGSNEDTSTSQPKLSRMATKNRIQEKARLAN